MNDIDRIDPALPVSPLTTHCSATMYYCWYNRGKLGVMTKIEPCVVPIKVRRQTLAQVL